MANLHRPQHLPPRAGCAFRRYLLHAPGRCFSNDAKLPADCPSLRHQPSPIGRNPTADRCVRHGERQFRPPVPGAARFVQHRGKGHGGQRFCLLLHSRGRVQTPCFHRNHRPARRSLCVWRHAAHHRCGTHLHGIARERCRGGMAAFGTHLLAYRQCGQCAAIRALRHRLSRPFLCKYRCALIAKQEGDAIQYIYI